jgi:hypothetical protein
MAREGPTYLPVIMARGRPQWLNIIMARLAPTYLPVIIAREWPQWLPIIMVI